MAKYISAGWRGSRAIDLAASFESPLLFYSSHSDVGTWDYVYAPFNGGDEGVLFVACDVRGEFKCVFRVFLHHELKLCIWGFGSIDMDVTGIFTFEDMKLCMDFVSPRDMRISWWSYEIDRVKDAFHEIWPEYRLVSFSPELFANLRSYHEQRVAAIPFIQDIKDVVLSHARPEWLSSKKQHRQLRFENLDYGMYLMDMWISKCLTHYLDSRWHVIEQSYLESSSE